MTALWRPGFWFLCRLVEREGVLLPINLELRFTFFVDSLDASLDDGWSGANLSNFCYLTCGLTLARSKERARSANGPTENRY